MTRWMNKLEEGRLAGHGLRSDYDLLDEERPSLNGARPAAVLVPIVCRVSGPTVLLTRRAEDLSHHSGQISFPGGKIDGDDAHAEAAALREMLEETGIEAHHVRLMGRLDRYLTVTGFDVTPVVGLVTPEFNAVAQPSEVAEIFEVPMEFIMDRRHHKQEYRIWKGERRSYYAIPYKSYYIWGATAAMLINLVDALEQG